MKMENGISVDCFEIARSMFSYPWLEYRDRIKDSKGRVSSKSRALEGTSVQARATPFCHSRKPDLLIQWRTLNDQRKERESQKMIQKRRNVPRYFQDSAQIQNLHVSISKLTLKSKEFTTSLKSPREDEQRYAAYALSQLGINDKSVMEALWQVAHTGSQKVKDEAFRALAILGCLNRSVIRALIKRLMGQNKDQRMETLMGLRVALNSWFAVPTSKRPEVRQEENLVHALQTLMNMSLNEASLEAALCLGFLRPCNNTVQEFLLQQLCQGPMTQRMKALRMLIKIMHIHSAAVTRAVLDQLCSSSVLDDRFEATQMLKTIGLEQIQAQGLEELTFDLLKKKTHNEPFLTMRQAVAETAEKLKMKPLMMKFMEAQLMSPDASNRQEAILSLGAMGIRNPQVFHLLLDMLDREESQSMKNSIQETLIVWASINPWIQKKLRNKVFFVYDIPKTTVKAEPTRFQKEPEDPEQLHIQDFRRAKLSPLSIAKFGNKVGPKQEPPAFSFYFSKPQKQKPQAAGPWQPKIREQLRNLVKSPNKFVSWA